MLPVWSQNHLEASELLFTMAPVIIGHFHLFLKERVTYLYVVKRCFIGDIIQQQES